MAPTPRAAQADVGVVGVGVMGAGIARNVSRSGYKVAVYDIDPTAARQLADRPDDGGGITAMDTPAALAAALTPPQRVVLLVGAGAPTDAAIDALAPHLEPGAVLIDAGNAHAADTRRREADLARRGLRLVGVGLSGGQVGALTGASVMAGGDDEAYRVVAELLQAIAATGPDGHPCCAHLGTDGAGHFVKTVHNGIEYADMQLIGEAVALLRAAGSSPAHCAETLTEFGHGDLSSYLLEVAAEVLAHVDAPTGRPFVDVLVDAAGMKGTGTWAAAAAIDLGVPAGALAEAVFARAASGASAARAATAAAAAAAGGDPATLTPPDRAAFTADVADALWCGRVVAYAQGLDLIRAASDEYGWDVPLAEVARVWRAGCIIRARLLADVQAAYQAEPRLVTLLAHEGIAQRLRRRQAGWRRTVATAVQAGVPTPALASALTHLDLMRAPRTNAALTQGMRDFFGAHTYRRLDAAGSYHTRWSDDRAEVRR